MERHWLVGVGVALGMLAGPLAAEEATGFEVARKRLEQVRAGRVGIRAVGSGPIAGSHHGNWVGENRLWWEEAKPAERSEGRLQAGPDRLSYTWSFRGKPQEGVLRLSGPAGALRGDWRDSWHQTTETAFHGRLSDGVVLLYGTYPAGEGPDWGWRIEIDTRDPEHLTLRMFNLFPDGTIVQAVDLHGSRAGR